MKKRLLFTLSLFLVFQLYPNPYTLHPIHAASTTSPSQTREEQAVSNFNQGTLPSEVSTAKPKEEETNLFSQALATIKNPFAFFTQIFRNDPKQKETFLVESENVHQSTFPEEVKPKPQQPGTSSWLEGLFKGFLGGSTGLYGADLPEFKEPLGKVSEYEEGYEKANFPEGINPITGQ